MATENMKGKLLAEHKEKMSEINRICTTGTAAEVESKLSELANIEKEYRGLLEKEVFMSLPDTMDALKRHSFQVIAHRKVSEEGRMVGVEASEKTVQIDLKRYCEFKSLPMDWFYELQALNKRLTLKIAMSLGMTSKEIRKINDSYAMDKLAEQIELGKTPDSNTQVIKHMQRVLDLLCPGAGKVNNYDLAYVMSGYTKRSNKESLKVVCSKHTVLMSLLTDAFNGLVTVPGRIEFEPETQGPH